MILSDSPRKKISLALVTYNQADLLQLYLNKFLQDGSDIVDLTIIDDGSDDETETILRTLSQDLPVHIHRIPHGSIAQARNHALRHTPTPWLAFSDTDCQLNRRYFETVLTIPSRFDGYAGVEGAVFPPPGPKPPFTHSLSNPTGGTFATANMVFHVPTILGLGGFDPEFKNFREDADLALTIIERYAIIPFCPELSVVHPHLPRNFSQSLRRALTSQSQIIHSEIRLFEKHPREYGRLRHHDHLHGTLRALILKYSIACLKEGVQYLFKSPNLSGLQRLQGTIPACLALVVAIWEQFCVSACCMVQLPKLVKVKSS